MEKLIVLMFTIVFGIKSGYLHAVPVSSVHQGGASYLPPLPETTSEDNSFPQSSLVNKKQAFNNLNSYTTSFKRNHNSQNKFEESPQIKSESSYGGTYHNSYSPLPSGVGKNVFLPPTPAPLPSLIANSVLKQLTSTLSTRFPSSMKSSSLSENSVIFPSIIMVDNTMEALTPSHNQTIFAAKLLASSLLQETAGSSSSNFDGLNTFDLNDATKLNSKDMFIGKAQKNAYIVPSNFNKMEIEELYSMRSKLDKAYTINQFIFIVKPENVNFLNKLV